MEKERRKPFVKTMDELNGQHLISLKLEKSRVLDGNIAKLEDRFDIETDDFEFSVYRKKLLLEVLNKLEFSK